ncbi:MAG: SHOCT domain-containing protein [Deltaproteobacteria bacterium]|nr:SHOCT domain-containing protein [Deltaproteobacteria bacterium]
MQRVTRWLLGALAVGMVFLLSACGRHGCLAGGWEGGWGPMMFPSGGMFMGMTLIVILVVVVIWWLIKGSGARDRGVPSKETPGEILKRRYAAGEITKEQFETMKRDLES